MIGEEREERKPGVGSSEIDANEPGQTAAHVEADNPGKRHIHVVLDIARYHHAKLVRAWLARPGCPGSWRAPTTRAVRC